MSSIKYFDLNKLLPIVLNANASVKWNYHQTLCVPFASQQPLGSSSRGRGLKTLWKVLCKSEEILLETKYIHRPARAIVESFVRNLGGSVKHEAWCIKSSHYHFILELLQSLWSNNQFLDTFLIWGPIRLTLLNYT